MIDIKVWDLYRWEREDDFCRRGREYADDWCLSSTIVVDFVNRKNKKRRKGEISKKK